MNKIVQFIRTKVFNEHQYIDMINIYVQIAIHLYTSGRRSHGRCQIILPSWILDRDYREELVTFQIQDETRNTSNAVDCTSENWITVSGCNTLTDSWTFQQYKRTLTFQKHLSHSVIAIAFLSQQAAIATMCAWNCGKSRKTIIISVAKSWTGFKERFKARADHRTTDVENMSKKGDLKLMWA